MADKIKLHKLDAEDQRRASGESSRAPNVEPRTGWFMDEALSGLTGYVHVLGIPVMPRTMYSGRQALMNRNLLSGPRKPFAKGELRKLNDERARKTRRT